MHRGFGFAGGIEHRRPFALEEGELAHAADSSSAVNSAT